MKQRLTNYSGIGLYFSKGLFPYYLIVVSYLLVLFSEPMPPMPGVVELLAGMCLVLGCVLLLKEAIKLKSSDYKWLVFSMLAGELLVIYPGISGLLNGVDSHKIARDLFPMLFLVILAPLIAYSADGDNKSKIVGIMLAGVLCVGAISPVEFLIDMRSEFGSLNGLSTAFDLTYSDPSNIQVPPSGDVARLSATAATPSASNPKNTFSVRALHIFEPAVTFAAIYCGCLFFVNILRRQVIRACIYAAVVAVALYGLSMLRLRAPVGLFVISQLIFISYLAYKTNNVKKQLGIAFSVLLVCLIVAIAFRDLIWGLILKNHLVGTNGKLEEWSAVFGTLSGDWKKLLMGIGWGGEFVPSYQLQSVRFTHSLFSFVLLKAGLLGLLLLAAVYARLIARFIIWLRVNVFQHEQLAIILAATSVLVIGFALQPTYKMLGFSVIVAILLILPINPNDDQERTNRS